MSKVEEILEKLRAGYRPASVATHFNVSRQYVYQVANKHNIDVSRNIGVFDFDPSKERHPATPPQARIITGGVPAVITHSVAGTICEFLVAADLMARGWQVYMPVIASKGHDLIASKNGRLLTIEVRSGHRNVSGTIKFAKKPDNISDVYAVVVTGEPVTYSPDIEGAP